MSGAAYQAGGQYERSMADRPARTDRVRAMALQNAVAAPARMLRAVSACATQCLPRDARLVVTGSGS